MTLGRGIAALVLVPTALAAQQPQFETTRIADGVYQFRWQSHNSFFVVTNEGVVVVDPISEPAARALAGEIRRVAPDPPLVAIAYSHDHADHATGANALRQAMNAPAARIIAHANALPKIAAANAPALPPPDATFPDSLSIQSGGRTISFHYLGRSHSDNMIVTLVPDVRVAFAVDFVANDRVGYQELPDYHFPEFFDSLRRLLDLPFDTIVFGHGPPGDRASIQRQIRYYDDLRNAVAEAVRNGWSEDRAANEIRLPAYAGWGQYGAWFPMNVRAIHRWLSQGRGLSTGG